MTLNSFKVLFFIKYLHLQTRQRDQSEATSTLDGAVIKDVI